MCAFSASSRLWREEDEKESASKVEQSLEFMDVWLDIHRFWPIYSTSLRPIHSYLSGVKGSKYSMS